MDGLQPDNLFFALKPEDWKGMQATGITWGVHPKTGDVFVRDRQGNTEHGSSIGQALAKLPNFLFA